MMQTTSEREPKLGDIDLLDANVYARRGVPHDYFKVLRLQAPVYRHPEPDGPGFWAITKYDDVVTVSMDPATFSSYRGGTNIPDLPEESLGFIRMIMLNMDPPQHVKFRRIVQRGFTPHRIEEMEPHVRRRTRAIVDAVAERGECEFVNDVAAELPLQVIADLMGVPQEERHVLFDLSNRLIGFEDPEFQTSPDDATRASAEMWAYANRLAERRKEKPEDDLTTRLLRGEVDGEKLSEMEFDSFFLLLAVAGNETTRNLIAHGMLALIQHPDARRLLVEDPSLIESGVEEMLRFTPPVMYFRRTATRDTEIRGVPIRAGDKVAMYYPSVNRDEAVFENPDVFDVRRSPNDHLAFGIGEHFCLGANLARLEIRIMFEELLRRVPDMELSGPVRRLRSTFIDGLKAIPVRFTPESRRASCAA